MKRALLIFLLGSAALAADELPDYQPQMQVAGVLRSRGNDQMKGLLKRWEAGFKKYQPGVQFTHHLKGTAGAMYGLDLRTADMALMGRPVFPYERYGTYERSWIYPVPVEVATGSDLKLHKSPAYAVFVSKGNPLTGLTLRQLDGIFGAERGGGWNALSWDTSVARTAKDNLRTWDQLGVDGPLAGQPIHVYGPANLGTGAITYFEIRVFGGGAIWNEDLREYADRKKMIEDLSRDPAGIGYAPLAYATADVKAVALAETASGPFVALTPETVAARTYPLTRAIYIYYTIDNEKCELSATRGDPRVKEFLRYVLSRQGQEDVKKDGSYLPLTPAVVQEQWKKINSTEPPPERDVLEE